MTYPSNACSAFPTIDIDHPHRLRGATVREISTGRTFAVLALIIWNADQFDACDQVIVAPLDNPEVWTTFYEFELEAS